MLESSVQANGQPPRSSDQSYFTSPPAVSLPKGGGALKGMGETFAANLVTGTGAMTVLIATSPGRSGFGPQLSLAYDSGAGHGSLGFGWQLSMPAITRKTDKGLPQYRDVEESDGFILSDAEDLVPVLDAAGAIAETERDGYRIRQYRPRIEGLFARIERWTAVESGETHWRSISKENVTTLYGKTSESRISDPSHATHIFSWLICESYDALGNAMLYRYKPEDSTGIDRSQVHERNRTPEVRAPQRYLKHIYYGNPTPHQRHEDLSLRTDWLFEVVFDYGEHQATQPTPGDDPPWSVRHDPFSSYRAGFEVRTYRLCQRVLMFHHFPEEVGVGQDCLVRSTDFTYSPAPPDAADQPAYSRLVAVTQTGYRREGAGYSQKSLPPLAFTYSEPSLDETVHEVDPSSLENLPEGLDGARYQWVDLDGEGVAGILTEQGGAWFYKRNLSPINAVPTETAAARFGAVERVASQPVSGLAHGAQFLDLAGDGRPDVVTLRGAVPGFYERTMDEAWESFRSFKSLPNVDWDSPNLRFIDLDGDGHSDILITEENCFVWHPSLAEVGFAAAEWVRQPWDEELGPRIVFADGTQSIHLADMSGDGLTDIVRIRNGEVCYWPNLGYGRFGAKVTMDLAPRFDAPDLFDQSRLRLADIDGSGTTDMLYLGRHGVQVYFNQSGNGWSVQRLLHSFPTIDSLASVMTVDLLGNGTACLVWSSPLPGNGQRVMRYIDLMGGQKPHLLVKTVNNLGAETTVQYAPSTKFYLQDRLDGKPWITKLPFPVQVVEKVTVTDKWRQTTFTSTYSYHHGYFDGIEREFRGFGRVEQTDVEEFGSFAAGNAASPYIADDLALYQPPVKTITWFHTGAFLDRERILSQFQQEYFAPQVDRFREQALPEPDLVALDLSAQEWREALRACKGMMLRQEVYELDVDALARGEEQRVRLFSTAFHNCHIQRLQPLGNNRHAVFLVTESEAITYHYELVLQAVPLVPDPRIAHNVNLRMDDYGNVLESVAIAYPRNERYDDASLRPDDLTLIAQVQQEQHLVYTENHFTHDVIGPDDHRLRLPCEVATYELTGLELPPGGYFSLAELRQLNIASAVPAIAYHALPNPTIPQKRLVEQVRMLYFTDDLQTPLPLGQINALTLPYETYKLALTDDLLNAVLGDRITPEIQQDLDNADLSGYLSDRALAERFPDLDNTGQYWIRSGIAGFGENPAARFYLPDRYTDAFGNTTTLEYDEPYFLFPQRTTDPLGNQTEVLRFNYRVLAPEEVRDPNQNLSEVAFDVLGMSVAMALKGKGAEGDSLRDVPLEIEGDRLIRFFTGEYNEAEARALLGSATARHLYYFGEQQAADDSLRYGSHPACAAGLVREIHFNQPRGGSSPIQAGFEYSDGLGAVLVTKTQAEPENPGEPLRWIATGKTILNNKGNPVKQYEPYFSPSGHRFEEPIEVGVTPILYYDAAGRQVRTDLPDGTYSRVEFSPWFVATWDASDTILEPENVWYARYTRGTPEEQRAARLATLHANTPAVTHLDSLGREVVAIAHNRFVRAGAITDEKDLTYTKLDAEGKPLWIQDARGNRVMEYITPAGAEVDYAPCYDIAGNLLFQHSMDGGDRWLLMDATGQPFYAWDINERVLEDGSQLLEQRRFHTTYDTLRRPIDQQLQVDGESPQVIERFIYGESQPEPQERNLRGQVYQHYDPSGLITHQRFDFNGNLLTATRQLTQTYATPVIDWNTETPSEEVFTQHTEYDALGRMTRLENWHRADRPPATYTPQYNQRGVLAGETLTVQGQPTEAILNIDYDAKGQRTQIDYGNGTTTRYHYDRETFRLVQLRTTRTRPGERLPTPPSNLTNPNVLQNLYYTYDPVGNITEIHDDAYEPVFFNNQRVEPRSRYTYDALYRLTEATGRENYQATEAPDQRDAPPFTVNFPVSDQALRNYTQTYTYDPVGNILQMRHVAEQGGWTRHYDYAPDSNRLLRTWLGSRELDAVRYDYDTHGSMLNLANTPDAYRLRWDYRDMIYTANLGGGGQVFYAYDSGKQRTRKRIERHGNTLEERLYLDGMELYRRWANGALTEEIETHHLFVDDQRALIVEDVIRTDNLRLAPGTLFRYQYGNHLGSVALELNHAAAIISYEEFHPYGTTAYQARNANINATAKRYRYTGMERDDETGLSYHTARYYLPWLGRWNSCDPIGVGDGVNVYSYVRSNPEAGSDVSGTQSLRLTAPEFGGQVWNQYQRIVNPYQARGAAESSRSHTDQENLDTLMLGVSEYSERDAQIEFQITIEEILSENQLDISAETVARSALEQTPVQQMGAQVLASAPASRQAIVSSLYSSAELEGVASIEPDEAQQILRLTLQGGFSDGPVSFLDRIRFEWRNTFSDLFSEVEANTSVRGSIRAFNLKSSENIGREEGSALEVNNAFQVWVNLAPTGAGFLMRLDIIELSQSGLEARLRAELTGNSSGISAQILAQMGYEIELGSGFSLSVELETGIGVNREGGMEVSIGGELGLTMRLPALK